MQLQVNAKFLTKIRIFLKQRRFDEGLFQLISFRLVVLHLTRPILAKAAK